MDTWLKILSAIALGAMLIVVFPRAKQALTASPVATPSDWRAIILPLLAVVAFVIALMALV